jgi:hypothetical protein
MERSSPLHRHCERSEAIQKLSAEAVCFASLEVTKQAASSSLSVSRLKQQASVRILAAPSARVLLLARPHQDKGAGKAGRRLAPAIRAP